MERPFRLIYALYVELGPVDGDAPGARTALVVHLHRDGTHVPNRANNGAPRPPQQRAIDLRPGDQLLCMGQWRTIRRITAFRDVWLTAAQARQRQDRGYLYRTRKTAAILGS